MLAILGPITTHPTYTHLAMPRVGVVEMLVAFQYRARATYEVDFVVTPSTFTPLEPVTPGGRGSFPLRKHGE